MNRTDSYEDQELISLLLKKDPSVCSWLYEKYAGALYTFIGETIPDTQRRNVILREVFITVLNTIEQHDPARKRLFTWMLGIARGFVLKENKLQVRELRANGEAGLGKWMKKLTPEDKNLLELSLFKGYSAEEMARHLNISPELAKSKLRNSLTELNRNR